MKVRVPLLDRIRGYATVETDATDGATLGVNLRTRDGRVLTEAEVLNPAPVTGDATPGVSIWRLLLEIPANVKALAAAVGQGFFAITGDGTGAMRSLQPGAGITITDGDGIDGDPVIAHADTSSAPSLASDNSGGVVLQDVFLTFDQFGHVTGAAAATVNLDTRYQRTLVAGTNVSIDTTDPAAPVISATGGGVVGGNLDGGNASTTYEDEPAFDFGSAS